MNKITHPNTIWIDIKKQIEFAIINGTYKSADKMPSITEVAELYDCGKSTAQKVLEEMFNEGYITKQKGVGYFVKPFVRDKLIDKYMKIWEQDLSHSISDAKLLNVNIETLEKFFADKVSAIYSR